MLSNAYKGCNVATKGDSKGECVMATMTFEQFKKIIKLAEELTDIQYYVTTKSNMLDYCKEFYDDSISYGIEDDHFYAILANGKHADNECDTCKYSDLRIAYKITYTSGWGTMWYFSQSATKDGQLLDDEISTEIMWSLDNYMDIEKDRDYSAEELIDMLETALKEK